MPRAGTRPRPPPGEAPRATAPMNYARTAWHRDPELRGPGRRRHLPLAAVARSSLHRARLRRRVRRHPRRGPSADRPPRDRACLGVFPGAAGAVPQSPGGLPARAEPFLAGLRRPYGRPRRGVRAGCSGRRRPQPVAEDGPPRVLGRAAVVCVGLGGVHLDHHRQADPGDGASLHRVRPGGPQARPRGGEASQADRGPGPEAPAPAGHVRVGPDRRRCSTATPTGTTFSAMEVMYETSPLPTYLGHSWTQAPASARVPLPGDRPHVRGRAGGPASCAAGWAPRPVGGPGNLDRLPGGNPAHDEFRLAEHGFGRARARPPGRPDAGGRRAEASPAAPRGRGRASGDGAIGQGRGGMAPPRPAVPPRGAAPPRHVLFFRDKRGRRAPGDPEPDLEAGRLPLQGLPARQRLHSLRVIPGCQVRGRVPGIK